MGHVRRAVTMRRTELRRVIPEIRERIPCRAQPPVDGGAGAAQRQMATNPHAFEDAKIALVKSGQLFLNMLAMRE